MQWRVLGLDVSFSKNDEAKWKSKGDSKRFSLPVADVTGTILSLVRKLH